jgi:hypothetical protein
MWYTTALKALNLMDFTETSTVVRRTDAHADSRLIDCVLAKGLAEDRLYCDFSSDMNRNRAWNMR